MPEKAEALGILLVLLPGFACAYIVHVKCAERGWIDLRFALE